MSSKIDRMSSLISEFRALRAAKREARLERMEAFLSVFPEIRRQQPVDFNVFSLLGVEADEVRHSRFLAWLLDAGADHGQGSIFLEAFSASCGLNIAPAALNRYHVRTEFSGTESIIDVMVCRKGEFLIYLENKVLAQESPEQIDREFRDMCRIGSSLRVPEGRRYAIFLTLDGRHPTSGDAAHWTAVSYKRIAERFEKLLPDITSEKVSFVLRDWIEIVSVFGRS
jgi:hypothetical protein